MKLYSDAIKEELIHINVIESLSGCLRYPPTDDSDDKVVCNTNNSM